MSWSKRRVQVSAVCVPPGTSASTACLTSFPVRKLASDQSLQVLFSLYSIYYLHLLFHNTSLLTVSIDFLINRKSLWKLTLLSSVALIGVHRTQDSVYFLTKGPAYIPRIKVWWLVHVLLLLTQFFFILCLQIRTYKSLPVVRMWAYAESCGKDSYSYFHVPGSRC